MLIWAIANQSAGKSRVTGSRPIRRQYLYHMTVTSRHFKKLILALGNGFCLLLFTLATGISIWKRCKGRRVNDAFVEDKSVAFRACDDPKMLGGGISPEEVGVDDINIALFVQRLRHFG